MANHLSVQSSCTKHTGQYDNHDANANRATKSIAFYRESKSYHKWYHGPITGGRNRCLHTMASTETSYTYNFRAFKYRYAVSVWDRALTIHPNASGRNSRRSSVLD